MDWQEEKAMMQRDLQKIVNKLNRAVKARDIAMERSSASKLQYKSAQKGLERCKIDAGRYQWLRLIGLRYPGSGEGYLHTHEADRTVDQGMKIDSYFPTITEERAEQVVHRRPRDLLNPALPPDVAKRLSVEKALK